MRETCSRKESKGNTEAAKEIGMIMTENELSHIIIGCAIDLRRTLGPGLLESVYENALCYDLKEKGFHAKSQVPMPLVYKDVKQDVGYRLGNC